MSNNSSCSSDSNTFQMYQDFDILFGDPIPRRDRWDHSQIDWDAHVKKLCHEQHFNREYQMSLQAFNKLISILSSLLKRNDVENSSSLFFQISCSQGTLNSSRLSCYLLLRLLVYMYLSQLMRTFTNYLKCIVISS